MNAMKVCLAYAGIGSFRIFWKTLKIFSLQPLPAKEHYYIMRLFRLVFKTYPVLIKYPSPLCPGKKILLLVDLCENNQQWYFRERGSYDSVEMALVAEEMENADAFIDIGSNIGVYATSIAQAFPMKMVTAVEPLEKNFETLQTNIDINALTNCHPRKGAVSSAGKPLEFYINPIHDGGGSLIAPNRYRTGDVLVEVSAYKEKYPGFEGSITVETFPLDSLIETKSVLKIDVEGAEADVIRSGQRKLKDGFVDLLIVEVLQDTFEEVVNLLGGWGFDSFLLPDYNRLIPGEKLPWFVRNIVCVRQGSEAHRRISEKGNS